MGELVAKSFEVLVEVGQLLFEGLELGLYVVGVGVRWVIVMIVIVVDIVV